MSDLNLSTVARLSCTYPGTQVVSAYRIALLAPGDWLGMERDFSRITAAIATTDPSSGSTYTTPDISGNRLHFNGAISPARAWWLLVTGDPAQ